MPETLFDKWMGYNEKPKNKKIEAEDQEADEIFAGIQDYMDQRRKRDNKREQKLPEKRQAVTPADVLGGLKKDLALVSQGICNTYVEQWDNLPEVKSFVKKKKKKMTYLPQSDSTILSAYHDQSYSSTVNLSSSIKEKMISSSLSRSMTSNFQSVDPQGYLTHLNTLDSSNQEVQDLNKLRSLFKSLISTNPKQSKTWLALIRLEEKAGNLKSAKDLSQEACNACQDSEDIWIEAARLESFSQSRALLTRASEVLPNSINIWMLLASKEPSREGKILVLKRALELNPEDVKLWKEIISHCTETEAKKFLQKAVICAPHSVDLWLALAKLQTYKEARKTLNEARKQLPFDHSIWIAAAKLEEAEGNLQNVQEMIKRGLKTLNNSAVVVQRKTWIEEASIAELAGSLMTCKAILRTTLNIGINEESQRKQWIEDFEYLYKQNSFEACRFFYSIVLEQDPSFKQMWKKAYLLENEKGNISKVKEVLKAACSQIKDFGKLWVLLLKHIEGNELAECLSKLAASEEVNEKAYLSVYRILMKTCQYNEVQSVLSSVFLKSASPKIGKKLISFYIKMNDLAKAQEIQSQLFSSPAPPPFIYKYLPSLFDYPKSKEILTNAINQSPQEPLLWIYLSDLELNNSNPLKSRFVLEQARGKCPCAELFIKSIEFELKQNPSTAVFLCNQALQKFNNNGKIWALAVELASKKEKKSKIAEAFQHCNNNLDLFLVVARIFAQERKMEKARAWFEKCLKISEEIGDVWLFYYEFERKIADEERVKALEGRIKAAEIRKGRIWRKVCKRCDDRGLGNLELIQEGLKEIII